MEQAVQTVTEGLPVVWARRFDKHTQPDGSHIYVDTQTGQVYDTLPTLQGDGLPADPARKR